MNILVILLIVLLLCGGLGGYGYRSGMYSANVFGGGFGGIVFIILILFLLGII